MDYHRSAAYVLEQIAGGWDLVVCRLRSPLVRRRMKKMGIMDGVDLMSRLTQANPTKAFQALIIDLATIRKRQRKKKKSGLMDAPCGRRIVHSDVVQFWLHLDACETKAGVDLVYPIRRPRECVESCMDTPHYFCCLEEAARRNWVGWRFL